MRRRRSWLIHLFDRRHRNLSEANAAASRLDHTHRTKPMMRASVLSRSARERAFRFGQPYRKSRQVRFGSRAVVGPPTSSTALPRPADVADDRACITKLSAPDFRYWDQVIRPTVAGRSRFVLELTSPIPPPLAVRAHCASDSTGAFSR